MHYSTVADGHKSVRAFVPTIFLVKFHPRDFPISIVTGGELTRFDPKTNCMLESVENDVLSTSDPQP
jgi:hypothetical protein